MADNGIDDVKIWQMLTADAIDGTVDDIRAQIRGGRSTSSAANALRRFARRYVTPGADMVRMEWVISVAAMIADIPSDLAYFMAGNGHDVDRAAVTMLRDARGLLPIEGGWFAAYERALNAEVVSWHADDDEPSRGAGL